MIYRPNYQLITALLIFVYILALLINDTVNLINPDILILISEPAKNMSLPKKHP